MAKGPIVTEKVRGLVLQVGLIDHEDWPAKMVQSEANERLGGKGPQLSSIQKILREARKNNEKVSPGLEDSWSLGASAKTNIPPEDNQDLLKIWKRCTIVGMTFTIREAQWVSRLRGLVLGRELYSHAVLYATRERVCKLLGREIISTTDLDMDIALPGRLGGLTPYDLETEWMSRTTHKVITGAYYGDDERTLLRKHTSVLDYFEKEHFAIMMMDSPASKMVELYLAILPGNNQPLSENADIVYIVWLRLLASGLKWKRMLEEAKNRIAQQLYAEVALAEKQIKGPIKDDGDSKTKGETTELLKKALEWEPSIKLLREVGLSEERTAWKLVSYESERSGRKPF